MATARAFTVAPSGALLGTLMFTLTVSDVTAVVITVSYVALMPPASSTRTRLRPMLSVAFTVMDSSVSATVFPLAT